MLFKDIRIGFKEAYYQFNLPYYKNNVDIGFSTQAMRADYQKAFGSLLYANLSGSRMPMPYPYENIYKLFEPQEELRILEIGARGLYFEHGVYKQIKMLDDKYGTDAKDRIMYAVLDISKPAIEKAKEEYKVYGRESFFDTEFFVADVLNNDEMKDVGKFKLVVMNELIDDIPHMVVTIKNKHYREIVFKPVYDENRAIIAFSKVGLRKLSKEDSDKLEAFCKLEEGKAITFSPSLDGLIANLSAHVERDGAFFIHDYFIRGPVDERRASILRRIYGYEMPDILYEKKPGEKVQITADVNLSQLLFGLSKEGFDAVALPHQVFINDMLGIKEVSLKEIAFSLNILHMDERIELLKKLGRDVGDNASDKAVNKALLQEVNKIIRGGSNAKDSIILDKGAFNAPDHKIELRFVKSDEEKKEILYETYRNSFGVKNPLMDVIAKIQAH
ncbi:MAG: SAM-dependent methyltransferase [Candidatus Micrarchaeia archaeon]